MTSLMDEDSSDGIERLNPPVPPDKKFEELSNTRTTEAKEVVPVSFKDILAAPFSKEGDMGIHQAADMLIDEHIPSMGSSSVMVTTNKLAEGISLLIVEK
ncbi:hypothetical protein AABB24_023616 [Solanum stoloniferum]|uniref:Uncharacterized protein n=1 Tax=Solanum stoloniferum TaxID=62892 RepID=A0ABD2SK84_9SOLN